MASFLKSPAWWRKVAINLALMLLVYFAVKLYMQRDIVTGPAPSFAAVTLNQETVTVPPTSAKGPMLLHFWATWCPVCRTENPGIDAVAEDHRVITVAMQSGSSKEVRDYMQKEGYNFPVVNDEFGELASEYRVPAVPVSFILDKQGDIVFVESGYTTSLGLRLRLWWAGLSD